MVDDAAQPRYCRALALTAVAYAVLHHLGLLPQGLGSAPEQTRWADWLDLAVPYLVLGPAAATLAVARPARRVWWCAGAGAVAYVQGHGVHLAANSVGNAAPGPTAHLWDEVVGHLLWYGGAAVVAAALATTTAHRPRPPLLGHLLAVAVGSTWATNAVGGGTVLPSLVVALAAVVFGAVHRRGLAVVFLVAGLAAVPLLVWSLL